MNLDHSFETLDVEEGELYTANLSRVRATHRFNVRAFVRRVGHDLDADRDAAISRSAVPPRILDFFSQLLFSCKINPRTLFVAGCSDS